MSHYDVTVEIKHTLDPAHYYADSKAEIKIRLSGIYADSFAEAESRATDLARKLVAPEVFDLARSELDVHSSFAR